MVAIFRRMKKDSLLLNYPINVMLNIHFSRKEWTVAYMKKAVVEKALILFQYMFISEFPWAQMKVLLKAKWSVIPIGRGIYVKGYLKGKCISL